MERDELYEALRVVIGRGRNELQTGRASRLFRHEATTRLLTNMFAEREAELVVKCFESCGEALTTEELAQKAGIPEDELRAVFDDMDHKGKLLKLGATRYMLLPYIPSASERYFIRRRDDPERMKRVAEAQSELFRLGLIDEFSAGGYSQFRVIPSIDPVKLTIAVNESLETENQVLPYEILEDHIARVDPQVPGEAIEPAAGIEDQIRGHAGRQVHVLGDLRCTAGVQVAGETVDLRLGEPRQSIVRVRAALHGRQGDAGLDRRRDAALAQPVGGQGPDDYRGTAIRKKSARQEAKGGASGGKPLERGKEDGGNRDAYEVQHGNHIGGRGVCQKLTKG